MPDPFRPSFWKELRRRRVVRAVSVYAVVAWVAVQVADTFFPALRLPDWTVTVVAVLAVLGFPATVAVAWIYERTAEGVRKQADVDAVPEADPGGGPAPAPGARDAVLGRQLFSALGLGAVLGMLVVGTVFWLAGGVPWSPGSAEDDGTPDAVAVLPFEPVGDANPTFTDGIHWDVLTRLSGVSGLDVISGSSVGRYAGSERPVSEIAGELGAGWILRGQVQQAGSRVQVHARLVDRRDRQVWARSFAEELTAENLFDIQRQITRSIVVALEDRLAPEARGQLTRGSTDNLEAWRLYVQGRRLLVPRTEASMRRAAEYFQDALDEDPDYAPAWAGLADALIYLDTFGFDLPDGWGAPQAAAERALELDPDLAEGHFALANLAHANRGNGEATRRAERAIELRPSYSDAFNLLSWIHKLHGRAEEGLETAIRAVDLDPTGSAPLSNLSLAHLALEAPGAAAREARRVQDFHPDFSTGRFLEALAVYHQGRYREALAMLDNVSVAWAPDAPAATRAVTRAALGDTAAARETLEGIDAAAFPFSAALVRAALGDTAAAADAIAGIERWDYWPTFAVRYFFPDVLRPLRRDTRYEAILERVDASWR